MIHEFLFGTYPYIALTVLFWGSVLRFERDPYTWKTSSSQLLRRKQLIMGSIFFHVGILGIFGGHFVGLLTPIAVFDFMGVSHGAKQILAVVAGGIFGMMCLFGGLMLLHRRLTDSRIRKTSSFGDIWILVLLMVQLLLGLSTIILSLDHLDGHEMVKFMNWAQGIFYFDPDAASYVADVHIIFKTHLLLGLTIFLLFPFTRLVHMLSAPIRYMVPFLRPGYQIVRSRHQSVRSKRMRVGRLDRLEKR